MNKNFDFSSKKFIFLTAAVCIAFLIIVINALNYLPDNSINSSFSNQTDNINKPAEVKVIPEENTNVEENRANQEENDNSNQGTEENTTKKSLNVTLPKTGDEEDFMETDTPDGTNTSNVKQEENTAIELNPEEKAIAILKDADKYRTAKQYIKALDEYQKIPPITSDKNIIASSYDGIASLYAINKRYGTALSYAIKAYNTYPTSEREMFLARLYYKTGDIDKATQRVNNILRRDFSDDRW